MRSLILWGSFLGLVNFSLWPKTANVSGLVSSVIMGRGGHKKARF